MSREREREVERERYYDTPPAGNYPVWQGGGYPPDEPDEPDEVVDANEPSLLSVAVKRVVQALYFSAGAVLVAGLGGTFLGQGTPQGLANAAVTAVMVGVLGLVIELFARANGAKWDDANE